MPEEEYNLVPEIDYMWPSKELTDDDHRAIWFSLRAYNEKLQEDLRTKYNGAPDWQEFEDEDAMFLGEQISRTSRVLFLLQEAGFCRKYNV